MKYDVVFVMLVTLHFIFFVNVLFMPKDPIDKESLKLPKGHTDAPKTGSVPDVVIGEDPGSTVEMVNVEEIGERGKRFIYITFTNDDSYLKGIMALAESLKMAGSRYRLFVMVTSDVTMDSVITLQDLGCEVMEVGELELPEGVDVALERWIPAFTKFRAWELDEYERVIWLDSDMLVFQNLDHLFHLPIENNTVYGAVDTDASSCVFKPERMSLINSGILVLKPSYKIYKALIDNIKTVSEKMDTVNDQSVIEHTLPWKALSYPEYGAQVTHCTCREERRLWNENVSFVHFTAGLQALPKPWSIDIDEYSKTNEIDQCTFDLYRRWNIIYEQAASKVLVPITSEE